MPSGYTEENGALVFVTSTSFTPGSGIAAAEAFCAARAGAAWLPGSLTFRAWLATPTASAASRFGWSGAYKRVDGRTVAASCSAWTSASSGEAAIVGLSSSTRGAWTESALLSCDSSLARYCVSDQPILFWDNFESGALRRWSTTAP